MLPIKVKDESGSGELFRVALRIRTEGGDKEDFLDAIRDNDAAATHLAKEEERGQGDRAIDRAWERSARSSLEFDDLDLPGSSENSLTFLTPYQCANAPARGYVIKRMIAPRDIACLVGAPGAGKSLLAPYLGYAVAQGRDVFGMRTKKGGVIYVAAEDQHGMQGRISALQKKFGDAENFELVIGVSTLLEGRQLSELTAAVRQRQPQLVVIDTLAMAFPGIEENSSDAMSKVVSAARSIANEGPAVILVHHGTKGGGKIPRGHSVLNGALDCSLYLDTKDANGIIRAELTKNRNGPCHHDIAFKIDVQTLGTDADGDPISVAIANELSPADARPAPKLTPSQKIAFEIFEELAEANRPVQLKEWIGRCTANPQFSKSSSQDSRRKAMKRAINQLSNQGVIQIRDDTVTRVSYPTVEFDDLDSDDNSINIDDDDVI